MKVGIIGVGQMGHGIAGNILKKGHELCFMDHPGNQPVEDLLAAGATAMASPAEVVRATEMVLLCVTGAPEVNQVMTGPSGVLQGLAEGQVIIDCSTSLPDQTRAMAARVAEVGAHFVDAAMTRTPKEAQEGRLNLIVGAQPDEFERVLPVLQCFAENIAHVGSAGAGHQMKLIHNFVSLGFSAVLAEAAACASQSGIDAESFLKVIGEGGGGGVVFERMKPFIQAGDTQAFRFSIANAHKDLDYYQSMVEAMDAARVTGDAVSQVYRTAFDAGHGARTIPELVAILAGRI